jgi:hypothetical protein
MGLVMGLVGDITLDLKITYQKIIKDSDTYTFAGMASFGIGHILYIVAISMLYEFSGWAILVGVGLNAAIFAVSIFLMKMKFGKWLIPSITYGFLLAIFMCVAGASCIIEKTVGPDLILFLIGSILFLLSDLAGYVTAQPMLSMTYFDGKDSKIMIIINHVLYYAAQFSIAVAVLYI